MTEEFIHDNEEWVYAGPLEKRLINCDKCGGEIKEEDIDDCQLCQTLR
jgi:hypothetical protein